MGSTERCPTWDIWVVVFWWVVFFQLNDSIKLSLCFLSHCWLVAVFQRADGSAVRGAEH